MTFPAARPTTYRGIPMRSRLEARYAARLDHDTTPVAWEYEPRAFADATGQYLPDFRVDMDGYPAVYVEVKPTVELAFLAMERMQIILSSEPESHLMVAVPCGEGFGQFARYAGRSTWVWIT